jgi:hypothetical protein
MNKILLSRIDTDVLRSTNLMELRQKHVEEEHQLNMKLMKDEETNQKNLIELRVRVLNAELNAANAKFNYYNSMTDALKNGSHQSASHCVTPAPSSSNEFRPTTNFSENNQMHFDNRLPPFTSVVTPHYFNM